MIAPIVLLAALRVVTYLEIGPPAKPLSAIGASELRSTVTVSGPCATSCPSGQMSIGAGEIVGRRSDGSLLVLTARHVIEDARTLTVFVRNGATPGTQFASLAQTASGRHAHIVAYASNVDLALVSFRPTRADDVAFAPFAEQSNERDAAGVVVGHPGGALWIASNYSYLDAGGTTFDLTCSTCGPGDSGGGVFDADGKLVGIVVQQAVDDRSSDPTPQFVAIGVQEMRMFLTFVGSAAMISPVAQQSDVWKPFDPSRP